MRTKTALTATIAALLVLLVAQSFLQKHLVRYQLEAQALESFSDVPANERIAPYLMGYQTTYANYLWIRTILYFGTHYSGDRSFSWLVSMVDIVTKLNPRFYPAYEFAGLMLPEYTGRVDASRIIIERGVGAMGAERWKIPFYAAGLYAEYYHDTLTAARYMALAAQNPRTPKYVVTLAATYLDKSDQRETARQYLLATYEASENPTVKHAILEKLKKLGMVR